VARKEHLKSMTKKKKKSVYEIMIEYGLPEDMAKKGRASLRYRRPLFKGIAWYWLSQYVRYRDVYKFGTCIYCGRPITLKTSDAAHYIPVSNTSHKLAFDADNIHASCSWCNRYEPNHLLFRQTLKKRYGEEWLKNLEERFLKKEGYTMSAEQNFKAFANKYRRLTEEIIKKYEGKRFPNNI